jgi:hypothetical protein
VLIDIFKLEGYRFNAIYCLFFLYTPDAVFANITLLSLVESDQYSECDDLRGTESHG